MIMLPVWMMPWKMKSGKSVFISRKRKRKRRRILWDSLIDLYLILMEMEKGLSMDDKLEEMTATEVVKYYVN